MRISAVGLDMICTHEGVRYTAYLDTGGVWTCGVGHTGPDVKEGTTATREKVREWLADDVADAEECIDHFVEAPLNQNEFDSLVSLVFNIGCSAFRGSTLLKLLNSGQREAAAAQFLRWKFDNGKEVHGLALRREDEKSLFLKPMVMA